MIVRDGNLSRKNPTLMSEGLMEKEISGMALESSRSELNPGSAMCPSQIHIFSSSFDVGMQIKRDKY